MPESGARSVGCRLRAYRDGFELGEKGQGDGVSRLEAQNATATGQEVATEAACVDTHAVGTGRSWPLEGRDLNAGDQPSLMPFHLALCKDSK